MQKNSSPQSWSNNLKLAAACPLCGCKFKQLEAKTIEEHGDTHLLFLHCQKCQHSLLNLIFSHPTGVGSMSLVTDLDFDDAVKFHGAPPLTSDDVLEAHLWLKGGGAQRAATVSKGSID